MMQDLDANLNKDIPLKRRLDCLKNLTALMAIKTGSLKYEEE